MNSDQRKVIVFALYGLSAALVFVFWRMGTQYDYTKSLLVWKFKEVASPSYALPNGDYGLRIRMGITGVVCGLIFPAVLAATGAFIDKADR